MMRVAAVVLLWACAPLPAAATSDDPTDRFSRNILSTLTTENAADLALLTQFYVERDIKPVWVTDDAPTERARDLVHVLEMATYDGLTPEDYDITTIRALMESSVPEELAELDLRLSLGLMRFLSDLGSGRTEPSTLDPELFVYPRDIDKGEAIRAAAKADDIGVFVGSYRPKQAGYWRLKGALANYRAIARAGGWPTIDPGATLKPGVRDPRVARLREILRRVNDLRPTEDATAEGGDAEVFDHGLAEAVKRFQARHGLEQDGHVGPKTLAALNTPVEARVRQLMLNLERRRWMPDRNEPRYIFINLADFYLQLIENDEVSFTTRVVIGTRYNKTPVFTADMTYLVFNPYWNVPPSIATEEILPKTKADPGYLEAKGFDLFSDWSENADLIDPMSVEWSAIAPENFRFKLRQRPSATNALGRLKFMLPNDYNIYLHDTPEQRYFDENERSFSHGCVRVAEPEELAAAILRTQPGWTRDSIKTAVASGERRVVGLDDAIPVQITYLTAWVDQDNRVHFRNDVYERDEILAAALTSDPRERGTLAADISAEMRADGEAPVTR